MSQFIQIIGVVFSGIGAFCGGAALNPISYLYPSLGDLTQRMLSGVLLGVIGILIALLVVRVLGLKRKDRPNRAGKNYCERITSLVKGWVRWLQTTQEFHPGQRGAFQDASAHMVRGALLSELTQMQDSKKLRISQGNLDRIRKLMEDCDGICVSIDNAVHVLGGASASSSGPNFRDASDELVRELREKLLELAQFVTRLQR